jgi:hypothetical protein
MFRAKRQPAQATLNDCTLLSEYKLAAMKRSVQHEDPFERGKKK